jgi:hypothetical protein
MAGPSVEQAAAVLAQTELDSMTALRDLTQGYVEGLRAFVANHTVPARYASTSRNIAQQILSNTEWRVSTEIPDQLRLLADATAPAA